VWTNQLNMCPLPTEYTAECERRILISRRLSSLLSTGANRQHCWVSHILSCDPSQNARCRPLHQQSLKTSPKSTFMTWEIPPCDEFCVLFLACCLNLDFSQAFQRWVDRFSMSKVLPVSWRLRSHDGSFHQRVLVISAHWLVPRSVGFSTPAIRDKNLQNYPTPLLTNCFHFSFSRREQSSSLSKSGETNRKPWFQYLLEKRGTNR